MAQGADASEALAALVKQDPRAETRQVAMVDASGRVAAHTGSTCMAQAGHVVGDREDLERTRVAGELHRAHADVEAAVVVPEPGRRPRR